MASPTRWTWVWVNSGSWWWEAWRAVIHGVARSQTWLSDWTELNSGILKCKLLAVEVINTVVEMYHLWKHREMLSLSTQKVRWGLSPLIASMLLSRFSRVWLSVTPKTAAHQALPSPGFSRQEHWSGLPFPSPMHEREKWEWSCSVVSDSSRPHGPQPSRLLHPWDFPGKCTGVGCHCPLWNTVYYRKNRTTKIFSLKMLKMCMLAIFHLIQTSD